MNKESYSANLSEEWAPSKVKRKYIASQRKIIMSRSVDEEKSKLLLFIWKRFRRLPKRIKEKNKEV